MNITEIICTLGPASKNEKILNKMIGAGMRIARINMSHGNALSQQELIDNLRNLRASGKVKLLIDTKGPEIRIGKFANKCVKLEKGQEFTLTTDDILGNEKCVGLKYKQLIKQLKVGDTIYANNGMIILKVKQLTSNTATTKVEFGGELTDNKGLNIPKIVPIGEFLTEQDKTDLIFAIKNKVDYVALSFVSHAQDVIDARNFLKENGAINIQIISKIENSSGVKNISQIIDVSDGIMVARGDLGVEMPMEQVPLIQKKIISLCNAKRKYVIVATEMLESMIHSTRPTRAEVSDIAWAVSQEANATMLSGETAVGDNPVLVVETMAKIIKAVEQSKYGR